MELQFLPEKGSRIAKCLLEGDFQPFLYSRSEWPLYTFVLDANVWTYDAAPKHFIHCAMFTTAALSLVKQVIGFDKNNLVFSMVNDELMRSIVRDIVEVHAVHMSGEATGAVLVTETDVRGLVAMYKTRERLNNDSLHYSAFDREELFYYARDNGMVLLNDEDALANYNKHRALLDSMR